jgi:CysZ protein
MKLGFWSGVGAVWPAFRFLMRTPRTWPATMVPGGILLVVSALLVWASFGGLRPLVAGWVGEGWFWHAVLPWLAAIVASCFGFLVALVVTPPLSAPALEHIVALRERDLGLEPRTPIGLFAEIWCGIRALAFGAALALPVLLICFVVDLFVPLAWVVTFPVRWFVMSLSVAWNLFDYPLTLRGVAVRDRWELMRTNYRTVLGFGLSFAALFWVPGFGILLLPIGVAAATELSVRIRHCQGGSVAGSVRHPGHVEPSSPS